VDCPFYCGDCQIWYAFCDSCSGSYLMRLWSFQPLEVDGQKLRQTGKLTFYFVRDGDRWLVRHPAEMPGFVPPREGQYTDDASPS
jgi:hypothetical protein